MANFVNNVIEVNKRSNDKGPYLELKIQKEDGKTIEKTVYGEACNDFTVPGRYEVESEKRKTKAGHEFWAITAARLILSSGSNEYKPVEAASMRSGADREGTETYRNDAITAQVAIKAAADITVAAIGKATQPISAEAAKEYVCKVAEGLIVVSTVVHAKKEEAGDAQEDLL